VHPIQLIKSYGAVKAAQSDFFQQQQLYNLLLCIHVELADPFATKACHHVGKNETVFTVHACLLVGIM
jgi:hypothetical protein